MKKIGFIGAYDKSNFIIYVAKILQLLDKKVLVLDATDLQKIRYIIPAINPTKSYITSFEEIDFGVGFDSWEDVEKYLGVRFTTNEENETVEENAKVKIQENWSNYDYVLIDVDSSKKMESFGIEKADKNYFVTSFDMFSLKKGIRAFAGLSSTMNLTRVLFSYENTKEDEEYLNFISLEYKINWNEYVIYFQILGSNNKVFEDNQRIQKIKFKRLSPNYRDSLAYVVQDIDKTLPSGKIKKAMRD